MYNLPDKSFRNSYNNRPQRQYEARRWDHNGYDELQYEQGSRYKNEEKNDRYKKNRKYQNDTTMASDLLEKQSQNERQGYNKDKWTHDKCEEVQGKGQSEQINREETDKNKTQKPARRERRPDKQLYSVRDKRKNEEMRERTQKEPEVEKMEVQDREKIAIVKEEGLKLPKSIGKGASLMEDDTKSTISNVSTAISDPLKGYEEETSILKESKSDLSQKKTEEKPEEAKMEPGESEALIEILLDTSKRELLRISESEEDYEGFLDNICERHGLGKRMSLYFKINILKVLQELHSEPQKVDPVLDRLLGINFKLIMVDSGLESVDEMTLPYMEDEESLFLETPPAENEEEEA